MSQSSLTDSWTTLRLSLRLTLISDDCLLLFLFPERMKVFDSSASAPQNCAGALSLFVFNRQDVHERADSKQMTDLQSCHRRPAPSGVSEPSAPTV